MTLDGPVRFYLEHRRQIEEWAALRDRVADQAHRFYCSLAEPIRERMAGRAHVTAVLDGKLPPLIALTRPAWGDAQGGRRVMVGLEWPRKRVNFENAFSGVRVERGHPDFAGLDAVVRPAVQGQQGHKGTAWWPAWRYERPSNPRYWDTELTDLRADLVDRVDAQWERFAPLIDSALNEAL